MQYDTFSHYPSILLSKNAKLPDARRIYVSLSMYSTHSASCMCTRKIGHLGDVYLIYWKQYILLYQICLTNAGRSSTLRDPVPASHLIAKHSWLLEASCWILGDFSDRLLLLCVSTWAEKTSRTRTKSLMAFFFFFYCPRNCRCKPALGVTDIFSTDAMFALPCCKWCHCQQEASLVL